MGLYIGTTPIKKVFVADGSGVAVESNKTVNPSESQTIVTPDTNYDALAQVTVNAVSSSYVGSGITRRDSTDLSASGATVTAPAGYYASAASKSVSSGTEGTPTATKGTVSNHSVLVTPSVTNTAGYISGGTKTGTAVTVSASELVSGSETKTSNGTYDVTNLAQLIVNVSGGGGGSYPWFGPNTVKDYTKTITINLANDTSWDSWTASTTATSILAAPTTNDFTYVYDIDSDVVFVVTTAITNYTFKSGATKTNIPISTGRTDFVICYGYPNNYTQAQTLMYKSINHVMMHYYNTSDTKITATANYGVYPYGTPSVSLSNSGSTVTLGIKRSAIYARCNAAYFATARKADIDSAKTNVVITFDVYKTPRTGSFIVHGYDDMLTAMNSAPEA